MKKFFLVLSALVATVACGHADQTNSAAKESSQETTVDAGRKDYSCAIQASNSKLQQQPLWTENFKFLASEDILYKSVGVTSPAANIIGIVSRETNSLGGRINLTISNQDTYGKAVAQFAEGDKNLTLLYSLTDDDLIALVCERLEE